MEAEIATAAGSNGSLASVGSAAKALVLTHPMTIAVAGGALLGIGAYHVMRKTFSKKPTKPQDTETAAA